MHVVKINSNEPVLFTTDTDICAIEGFPHSYSATSTYPGADQPMFLEQGDLSCNLIGRVFSRQRLRFHNGRLQIRSWKALEGTWYPDGRIVISPPPELTGAFDDEEDIPLSPPPSPKVITTVTGKGRFPNASINGMVFLLTREQYEAYADNTTGERYKIFKRATPLYQHEEFLKRHQMAKLDRVPNLDKRSSRAVWSLFELPPDAFIGWSFVRWRGGKPVETIEGAVKVSDLTGSINLSFLGVWPK